MHIIGEEIYQLIFHPFDFWDIEDSTFMSVILWLLFMIAQSNYQLF